MSSGPTPGEPDLDLPLVLRARAGDREAFAELVRRHQDRVIRTVKRLRQIDHETAEDLAQEVFVRAWRHLGDFRAEGPFAAWIYRIAFNLGLGQVKKTAFKAERRQASLDSTYDDGARIHDPAEPRPTRPDRFLERGELTTVLEYALSLLPEEFKAPVLLCDVEGLDYEQIAAILGVPVGTVRSRIHRGRERLKDVILRRHGVPATDVEARSDGALRDAPPPRGSAP